MSIFSRGARPFTPGYKAAEAEGHDIALDEFGEAFTHIPMVARPNYSPAPDASREARDVRAVFSWRSREVQLGHKETHVISRIPTLFFKENPARPIIVHRCDVFERHADGLVFEVHGVKPDGMRGVVVELVQLGLAPMVE